MIINLWRQKRFIWRGALRNLKHRHAGTVGGAVWHVLMPLAQLAIFAVVFSNLMKVRLPELSSYRYGFAVYLCSGFIPWIGFAEAVQLCTASLVANSNYLKKLPIAEQVFVAQDALSSFLSTVIAVVLMVLVSAALHNIPQFSWLQLIPILIMMQIFAFGLGMALGVLNVFFRDVSTFLPVILMLWMWSTPIVYVKNILPERFLKLLYFNPAFYYIEALHKVMIYNTFVPNWWYCVMFALAFLACSAGYLLLRHFRPDIRDAL